MGNEGLKKRTKQFALDLIKLVQTLPSNRACNILGGQSLSAGTSVGANYHAPAG
jgi:four helix bundle protein